VKGRSVKKKSVAAKLGGKKGNNPEDRGKSSAKKLRGLNDEEDTGSLRLKEAQGVRPRWGGGFYMGRLSGALVGSRVKKNRSNNLCLKPKSILKEKVRARSRAGNAKKTRGWTAPTMAL